MKKLTHCPHCQSPLKMKDIPEHLNHMKYEYCEKRCTVDYFRYFDKSYDDDVQYVSLYTPNKQFHLYWYLNHYMYAEKMIHVYSEVEMKKYGKASPCIAIAGYEVDLFNLEKVQKRFKTYVMFA